MMVESFCPVKQVSVERACLAFYLDMALDGYRCMSSKRPHHCAFWRRKGPGIAFACSPVGLFDPFGAFLGVFAGHLLPEHMHQQTVAHRESLLGDDRSIVERPAGAIWISLVNE